MDMNISKYLAFVTTVEYGSFTRASEILSYSQSGISRMIADLEHEWSLSLLERGRQGVRLTSDGERLLPYAKRLCSEYSLLQAQVDELRGVRSGTIRIGAISSIASHWLPNIIRAFQTDYPGIDYELTIGGYAELGQWVHEGTVDCAFTNLIYSDELDCIPLEEDRYLAVLPKGHELARLGTVPIASLCSEPFMLLENAASRDVSELFERNGLKPRVHFTTWEDYAIMSMVESGFGVGMLPELILRRIVYDIEIRPTDKTVTRSLGVILRDRRSAPSAVKKFLEYVDRR